MAIDWNKFLDEPIFTYTSEPKAPVNNYFITIDNRKIEMTKEEFDKLKKSNILPKKVVDLLEWEEHSNEISHSKRWREGRN